MKTTRMSLWLALALAVLMCVVALRSDAATLRTENTFAPAEWDAGTGTFLNLTNKIECESRISYAPDIGRGNVKGSIRFETGLKDVICADDHYRAEVAVRGGGGLDNKYAWDTGITHWVGLSMFPRSFDAPTFTLLQIHAPNERGGSCDYGGNAVALQGIKVAGVMHFALFVIRDGSKTIVRDSGAASGSVMVWSAPMDRTRFTDFVIAFNLSTVGKGRVQLWRNGARVLDIAGLTNVNPFDSCGNRITDTEHNGPHVGVYGPPATGGAKERKVYGNPYREVFVDQLRTASGDGGYSVVNPARK